ncbi:purple acid phosphatase family protein [Nonomuraea aridisoli]|uniref:Metallophosphoesterase n=1 Tax=Nonomuraea aridisoli TaxID=2070368 RepID=A0A2W2EQD2_9ACTN|nr:metallophosphoesterase family protein [Nonomuraea aridisoli]PZG11507.1 metallophosphoesterase [Nonomuraea aridisoli]
MPGCDFTRRDLLRWSAVAAAAPAVSALSLHRGVAEAATRRDSVSPANLELVTLTEDRAIITWYTGHTGSDDGLGRMEPAPADGEVRWGTRPDHLNRVAHGLTDDTPYHYVELRHLEPGRTYYYQAFSNGKPVPPTAFTLISGNAVGTSDYGLGSTGPFSFTTPEPPPGRHLFTIALCNDLHMGETQAGLVGGQPQYIGISQEPGLPPYPEVMLEALVRDAGALGADYLLAAGDISAEAVPVDLSMARRLLGRFGDYRSDFFVTRGNHDRAHIGDPYANCRAGQWQGNDCFRDHFFDGTEPTYFARELQGLRVIGIDTYDKPGNGGDPGALSADQLDWFRTELARDRERPTMVFGHHPLIVQDSAFPISPSNTIDAAQAQTILEDYANTPGLFLHHAGHTHRNKRTISPIAPDVVHQEIAAGKEYPGGFSLLRVHTGGYALNFYKTRSELARRWSERSRMEIQGYWPQFALGSRVSDRNIMAERDFSGLRKPSHPHGGEHHDPHQH